MVLYKGRESCPGAGSGGTEHQQGILEDFLKKNRAEAMKVSIYEYDARKHIEMEKEDSYKDGYQAGEAVLLQIVQKKLSKGKTIPQIAADLEIDEDSVTELIGLIEKRDLPD